MEFASGLVETDALFQLGEKLRPWGEELQPMKEKAGLAVAESLFNEVGRNIPNPRVRIIKRLPPFAGSESKFNSTMSGGMGENTAVTVNFESMVIYRGLLVLEDDFLEEENNTHFSSWWPRGAESSGPPGLQ